MKDKVLWKHVAVYCSLVGCNAASSSGTENQKSYSTLKDDQKSKHRPPVAPRRKKAGRFLLKYQSDSEQCQLYTVTFNIDIYIFS